jgi:hypothetical protein
MNNGFLSVLYGVAHIYALGLSALVFLSGILNFVGVDWLWLKVKHAFDDGGFGVLLIVVFGCFAVALAIYDGQFVDKVKKSHWSKNLPR